MGYWQDELKKIEMVEQQGFNPYTETYSGRIGQLPVRDSTQVPLVQESGLKHSQNTPQTTQPVGISQAFSSAGYDDPFQGIVTDKGLIDYSKLSSGYNLIADDPKIGITQDQYIDFVNRAYPKELGASYYEGAQLVRTPEGTLQVSKQEVQPTKERKSRFEKMYESTQKKDLYFEFDADTGEKIRTFETEADYNKAREEYDKAKANK